MKKKVCLFLLLCLSVSVAWSQNRKVTGRVISDTSKQMLSGVSVSIKGLPTAVITSDDGKYNITVPNRNNVVLVFTSVGFKRQEVNVGNRTTIDVVLTKGTSIVDEQFTGKITISVGGAQPDMKTLTIQKAVQALMHAQ